VAVDPTVLVGTASVLATAAKAAAPRVSVTWSVLVGIVLATRAHARGRVMGS
jgi:hypothetical protein